MAVNSAGLLVFRRRDNDVEVLLVHPGGPFWGKKDDWLIPKGELEDGEDLLPAAAREFKEELNAEPPEGVWLDLGQAKGTSGKTNYIWAVEGDVDLSDFRSNTFTMEWPPKSGNKKEFPENDRAAWFPVGIAKVKVYKTLQIFIERLIEKLELDIANPPEQQSLL